MVRQYSLVSYLFSSLIDLADGGAHHFAETIMKIKQKSVGFDILFSSFTLLIFNNLGHLIF